MILKFGVVLAPKIDSYEKIIEKIIKLHSNYFIVFAAVGIFHKF